MTFPVIHLNGTSPETLLEGYRDAYAAIGDAIRAIGKIEFDARDYYPAGMETWNAARDEHWARLQMLTEVQTEFLKLAEHCMTAVTEREKRRAQ